MDPVTGMMIMQGLGGLFGGLGGQSSAKKDRKESRRQFDLGYGLNKRADDRMQTVFDKQMDSQSATSPMRQAIVAQLMDRFGLESPGLVAPSPRSAPSIPLTPPTVEKVGGYLGGVRDKLLNAIEKRKQTGAKVPAGGAPQLPPSQFPSGSQPGTPVTSSSQLVSGNPMQSQIAQMLKSRFWGMGA